MLPRNLRILYQNSVIFLFAGVTAANRKMTLPEFISSFVLFEWSLHSWNLWFHHKMWYKAIYKQKVRHSLVKIVLSVILMFVLSWMHFDKVWYKVILFELKQCGINGAHLQIAERQIIIYSWRSLRSKSSMVFCLIQLRLRQLIYTSTVHNQYVSKYYYHDYQSILLEHIFVAFIVLLQSNLNLPK